MSFLKFQADTIFTGTEALDANMVLITDDKGKVVDVVNEAEAGLDIQQYKGIISPGFINCHCHLELSHLKGKIPEQTGIVDFILQILQKRNTSPEIIQDAIELAENEMIENGIVAVGDICNTNDTLLQKQKNKLYYHNFIEVSGFLPEASTSRFNQGEEIYNQFTKQFPHNTSLVPHAPYSVSEDLFKQIQEFSENKIVSIHNQESNDENLFFKEGKGDFLRLYKTLVINIEFFNPPKESSLEYAIQFLNKARTSILVHNTHTSFSDLELIKNTSEFKLTQFYLCLCVLANRYISGEIPPEIIFQQNFNKIVIGTDSLASNSTLNILEEIKTLKLNYPKLSQFDLLQFATYNGAVALNMDDKFGSFIKGKKPGVLLIENLTTCTKPKKLV